LARTIYRELRRARYEHQDLARFVGDLMDVMIASVRDAAAVERPRAGVIEPETGLPNRSTLQQILDFEIRRADEAGGASLLLFCVDVHVPDWCPDDLARRIHAHTARSLQRRLRAGDVVARLSPSQYLALLPNATTDLVLPLCARFGAKLQEAASGGDALPAGSRYAVRWVVRSDVGGSGVDLLDRCLAAPTIPLGVIEEDRPPVSLSTRQLSRPAIPRARAPSLDEGRSAVLALGGRMVRASAHVGVMDVLADAGVEIDGVVGTGAGALVGAMLLLGQSRRAIIQRFESFAATPIHQELRCRYARHLRARRAPHAATSALSSQSDSDTGGAPDDLFAAFIEYFVGPDRDIATLSRPFVACATDLVAGRPALFMRGPLHQALRASCAVPGLFAPQRDGHRLLVDGSTVAEVPVAAALGLGASSPVLGVYLEAPARAVSSLSTAAAVLTRAAAIVHDELVREQLRSAPLLLTIPVRDRGWLDFGRAREVRQIGELVTRIAIERLLADLDRVTGERKHARRCMY
jgi:predicted acylesterase/phospholipase RssA/GGDEF domain-containing protein